MSLHRIPDETWSMPQLIRAFEALTEQASSSNRLSIEEKKLIIIHAVENTIKREMPLLYAQKRAEEKQVDDTNKLITQKIAYYFLLIFGFFDNAATSYFFGSTLFALIPAISDPVLMITSIGYTVLEAMLFYAFDVSLLNDVMGVAYTKTPLIRLIETYSQQLKRAIAMNQYVSSIPMLTLDNILHAHFVQFTRLLNHDLRIKYDDMGTSNESAFKKAVKVGMVAFGAISSVAGSFFMATAFMAESFVATPAGMILIALTVITGLGFHYAMDMTGMSRIVNPEDDKQEALKKEWSLFLEEYPDSLQVTQSIKQRFEKKQTQDASTQTDSMNMPLHQHGHSFFTPAASTPEGIAEDMSLTFGI